MPPTVQVKPAKNVQILHGPESPRRTNPELNGSFLFLFLTSCDASCPKSWTKAPAVQHTREYVTRSGVVYSYLK